VTTVDGLEPAVRNRWAQALVDHGGSQCGFCSPGILVRLVGLAGRGSGRPADRAAVERALAAHLCRCTGWQTIVDAACEVLAGAPPAAPGRDLAAAAVRATIEGGTPQRVGLEVALGRGGFADDDAPVDALVAVPDGAGGWSLGSTVAEARRKAGWVPGRNSTRPLRYPVPVPEGDWALRLQTTFVEPAYVEPDASWCRPGGTPASPFANGGAFGGKLTGTAPDAARLLAEETGRCVRVVFGREDVVRLGPKRPPVAAGLARDGTGVVRVARTPGSDLAGWVEAFRTTAPGMAVEVVDVPGPPVSGQLRGAGWVEGAVLTAALAWLVGGEPTAPLVVTSPAGASASARVTDAGSVEVTVRAGDVLDEVVLRSYAIGAVHQATGWVRSEGVAVDDDGVVHDLTIRSFGILPAQRSPAVTVTVEADRGPAVPGGDAVFAAAAAAWWVAAGLPERWPTERQ
jgi:xanthine dehydrogenase small subunit